MGFTSLAFLVFLAVVLTLYYLVPRRFQWVLLLIASYAFYLISGIPQVLFLLGTTAVTYFSGLWMQKVRNQYKARLAENLDLEKAEKQRRKKLADAKIHRIKVWTLVLDLLVLGIVKGYDDPADYEAKKQHYALVREFADRYKKKNASINCRELLTLAGLNPESGGEPEQRSEEFYQKRPCPHLVYEAAVILDEMLQSGLTAGNDIL